MNENLNELIEKNIIYPSLYINANIIINIKEFPVYIIKNISICNNNETYNINMIINSLPFNDMNNNKMNGKVIFKTSIQYIENNDIYPF